MRHMLKENLGLITSRQMDKSGIQPVFITNTIIDAHSITSATSISYLFPLFLYPDEKELNLLNYMEQKREPNIDQTILLKLQEVYDQLISPEQLLQYIYAVLSSPLYQQTYADFLKFDFPRVPFTADSALFQQMAALGKRLVDLHLLRSPELEQPIARFEGKGDDLTIATPKYDPKTKRVWINATYYFEGITPEVWEYQIGGYQVLDKYLKARKGRSLEDPRHILRVATSLAKTIEIQQEIDALYPKVEEDLITF